jgi:hypothetical protein
MYLFGLKNFIENISNLFTHIFLFYLEKANDQFYKERIRHSLNKKCREMVYSTIYKNIKNTKYVNIRESIVA